jgi:hypothetical protein
LLADFPVLAPRAGEVARPTPSGQVGAAWVEVKKRLFLNWVCGDGRDGAIGLRNQNTTPVLPRFAPTLLPIAEQAAPFAGQAANSVTFPLLQQCFPNENRSPHI